MNLRGGECALGVAQWSSPLFCIKVLKLSTKHILGGEILAFKNAIFSMRTYGGIFNEPVPLYSRNGVVHKYFSVPLTQLGLAFLSGPA